MHCTFAPQTALFYMNTLQQKNNKQVAIWLLIGVGMIVFQIVIGGITRLTESGLSITEWEPIKGALPPLNEADWIEAFNKYKTTDQFKYVHQRFTLSDFKFIFFWEWFHRVWARLLGVVFLIGFVYFLMRKKFNRQMVFPMLVLFLLGAMQGLIGWVMVKSGLLPQKFNVGHVELTTHLIAAIILLSYTLWFALSLLPEMHQKQIGKPLRWMVYSLIILLFFQLIYGGFMAGLKAAAVAPTWPNIQGSLMPVGITELSPLTDNFINNKLMVHFMHRGLAYLLFIAGIIFYIKTLQLKPGKRFVNFAHGFIILLLVQVVLGIITVMHGTQPNALVFYGVAHQFTAMLLVISITCLAYLGRRQKNKALAA